MPSADVEKWIPRLIRQVLGAQAEIVRTTVIKSQADSLVAVLDLSGAPPKIVLKLAGPAAPNLSAFDRTASILKQVASDTHIQVPDVLAVDVTYQAWPWRYLITTFLEGEEWASARAKMSSANRKKAYAQIGDALGQLHSIFYPDFGEISPLGGTDHGQPVLAALVGRARLIIQSPRSLDLFLSVLDRDRHLFAGVRQACLCHEDLHRHNILFVNTGESWRLKTILDFDKAWAGHSESDLARLSFWKGMTSPEFWKTYRDRHVIDAGFQRRQLVYQLLWCLEFARPDPKHLADTQGICQALGVSFSGEF